MRVFDSGDLRVGTTAPTRGALAIVQARTASLRFPRKILAELQGLPLVEFMIQRVLQSTMLDEIVLAVPNEDLQSPLTEIAARQGIELTGGPATDVLSRIAAVARRKPQQTIVRLTADCPLVDPAVIDTMVQRFLQEDIDYLRTGTTFPDGLDVEVTTRDLILQADEEATQSSHREHVTSWIAENSHLRRATLEHPTDLGCLRLTVDEPVDLEVVRSVLGQLPPRKSDLAAIQKLWLGEPHLFAANAHLERNEGASISDSQKLWRRATRVIPGGVSLLSKRPDMHIPDKWPTYFTEAKGSRVKSLDGREYVDMGLMGVGTSILGFGHGRVDEAVSRVIGQGVVSSLNCPEEVLLAERLVDLHPWSTQARFARTGGEACAMAVRIARAASGRDKVAICGYHGWHDWYLAANLAEDGTLDGHLLPGLSVRGVPRALTGTSSAFPYNDLRALEKIIDEGEVGVIVMEVERSSKPAVGFLEGVRELASQNGIVLVFDESTSGFRKVLGGHHLTLGVDPDMAIFGKTLGNGYAITSVIGRDSVMDVAKDLFLSSTFWSERIGPAAALASLAAMEEEEANCRVHLLGLRYRETLLQAANQFGMTLDLRGLPALTSVGIPGWDVSSHLKTYISQELLNIGYLAGPTLYASLPHETEIDRFVSQMSRVLATAYSLGPEGVAEALEGQPIATMGFSRLA